METLRPLADLTAMSSALRDKLQEYWITTVDEFVATALSGNEIHGSGLAAMALALGMREQDLEALVSAAQTLLPSGRSYSVPTGSDHGTGLVLGGYRDPAAASFRVPTNLPEAVEPLGNLPPPGDQGERNSCVAFALTASFQVVSGDPMPLSEQFLYWACKQADGIPGDVGTNPLTAFHVLRDTGICRAATWPYAPAPRDNDNPGHGPPPDTAVEEATLRRAKRFTPLPAKDFRALQSALANGHPVLVGLNIREHWEDSWQATHLGRVRKALPGERDRGGHAMCLMGYRNNATAPGGGYFIVRNSWGTHWAKANPDGPGFCHVPYRLMAENGLVALALEQVVVTQPSVRTPAVAVAPPVPVAAGAAATAGDDLAQLYAEAKALHSQMGALVERLAGLLGSEGGAAATSATKKKSG